MDFYTFQPVSMHRTIAVNLTKLQMGKVVTICENTSHRIRSKFSLWAVPGWVNAIINELYLTAHVTSLPDVPLPMFDEFADSNSRLAATLKYEWGTARIELELLLGDMKGNWASLGETAIKNSSGYRYRRHRLLDLLTDNPGFQLEENFKLGVLLKNMGFGDITDKDSLSITGNWIQEFVAIQQQPPYVVNNNYGGSSGGSVTPVYVPPTLTLTLNSGSTIYPGSGSTINISLIKGSSSKTYTATWKKDGTATTVTVSLTTDSNGTVTLAYDSSLLANLGAGTYKLEFTDNNTTISSNELTAVMPTVSVSPTNIYNNGGVNVDVTVTGMEIGSTYTLGFVGLPNTSGNRTQTDNSNTFTILGTNFSTAGTYKARVTKGAQTFDSNDLTVTTFPVLTLTPNLGIIANNTTITALVNNLQKNASLTYYWLKNGVQVSSATGTTDASGNWTLSLGANTFQNSPYGEGTYRIRVVQGSVDLTSTVTEIRQSIFYTQPSQNQVYSPGQGLVFDLTAIPTGASFTYQLFKNNVALGTPTNQTFTPYNSGYPYHRLSYDTTDIYNSYGYSDFYTVRIVYSGSTYTSNTFCLREAPPVALG